MIKKKKYKPAAVKYTISKLSDYKKITDAANTKSFVYMNLVNAVKTVISEDVQSVDLFKLHGSNVSLSLPRSSWKTSLTKAMEFFTEKEMFETCVECQKLIETIK